MDGPPLDLFEPLLSAQIDTALQRIRSELERVSPYTAAQAGAWMRGLADAERPSDYFKNPVAFPLLLLPWWLGRTLGPPHDVSFHADVVYSTINGYYFVRLVDNVMDENDPAERPILPLAAFFHTEFQTTYEAYFKPRHEFWSVFRSAWYAGTTAAIDERAYDRIDLARFVSVSGRKMTAARIPIAAVCFHHGQEHLVGPWSELCDRLGQWAQMMDDLFDWHRDLSRGAQTHFLSEALLRKRGDQSVAAWVVLEGFAWGIRTLESWMEDVQSFARPLSSPALDGYLAFRLADLRERRNRLAPAFQCLATFAAAKVD